MAKRLLTVLVAILTTICITMASAQNATAVLPAGNGTNDFYLSKGVRWRYPGFVTTTWFQILVTNWDYGSNQKYHVSTKRTISMRVKAISRDGRYFYTTSISDRYFTVSGHGAHRWCVYGYLSGRETDIKTTCLTL